MTKSSLGSLRCHECKKKTKGTLLIEQAAHTPYDSGFFQAPLCHRVECRKKAREKGAMFA